MKSSKIEKTIIALYDDKIQYLTLARSKEGFFVKNYDSAKLEKGIIENGYILRADFLKNILLKIAKKINTQAIDLLIPHKYFLFDTHTLKKEGSKNPKKLLKKYLKEHTEKISWAHTHSYEYDFFESQKTLKVLFRAIPQEMYSSHEHAFKKSGLKIHSIHSQMVSYAHIFPKNERISQIFVDETETTLLEYKDGIYISDKKFNVSYQQFITDIKKNVKLSELESQKILNKYGVLKNHPDMKVLARIERSMNPLLDFLRKRQIKETSSIYVIFSNTPIRGFSDRIKRLVKSNIYDFCILKTKKYHFQEILSLHKKESYQYESLIARALSLFDKK